MVLASLEQQRRLVLRCRRTRPDSTRLDPTRPGSTQPKQARPDLTRRWRRRIGLGCPRTRTGATAVRQLAFRIGRQWRIRQAADGLAQGRCHRSGLYRAPGPARDQPALAPALAQVLVLALERVKAARRRQRRRRYWRRRRRRRRRRRHRGRGGCCRGSWSCHLGGRGHCACAFAFFLSRRFAIADCPWHWQFRLRLQDPCHPTQTPVLKSWTGQGWLWPGLAQRWPFELPFLICAIGTESAGASPRAARGAGTCLWLAAVL